tara:strand:- start:344 stop:562 length:219 start_codon:yes stop_codon:yes gene_type:complete
LTKYESFSDILPLNEIDAWIRTNLNVPKNKGVLIEVWNNGKIKSIDIQKALSTSDKKKLTDKFPALKGKEIM